MKRKEFLSRLLAMAVVLVMVLSMLPIVVAANEGDEAHEFVPRAPRVFEVGPDREFDYLEDLRLYMDTLGPAMWFGNMHPGDTILIYPNIVDGRNIPYLVPANGRLWINANGTEELPITIRGVVDSQGNRPIITNRQGLIHSVLTVGSGAQPAAVDGLPRHHTGDWLVIEDLIIDGGMSDMFDFFNGIAEPGNRFYDFFGPPPGTAFNEDVTFENFPILIHTPFVNPWFADSARFGTRSYGGQTRVEQAFVGTPYEFMMRNGGTDNIHGRSFFSSRALFLEGGNNIRIHNTMVVGAGTGLHGGNAGTGNILVSGVEAAYNGMWAAGHNMYFNGDPMRHPNLTLTMRNSFVHNSIGTQGFRSRIGRNIIQNNLFLNNAAKQVDLVGLTPGSLTGVYPLAQAYHGLEPHENLPHWESIFDVPLDTEFIGNVSIVTGPFHINHVHIGGAGMLWEESWGRYRFLNNTFVHLAGYSSPGDLPREAIGARFGVESVELYNNVFYSQHDNFYAFIEEMTAWSEITWAFGERQIAGSNNWLHYNARLNARRNTPGYGYLTDYITDTIFGAPGEMPFVDLGGHEAARLLVDPAAFDLRIKADSSAISTGVPVSTTAEFMTYEEFAERRDAGLLPDVDEWKFVDGVQVAVGSGSWPGPAVPSDVRGFAQWRGLGFGDSANYTRWRTWQPPVATNIASPPINFVATPDGFVWGQATRADSTAPQVGAFNAAPVFSWDIFNNGPGGAPSRPNPGLAASGTIRMWAQLGGANTPVRLAAADTIVALDQNGQCAIEFVTVNRMWVAGTGWTNYFNLVDVSKDNGSWQHINLYITVYGQTVHVLLVNALFVPPIMPEFGWNIFNNGPGGTQYPRPNPGLAASGTIRMWTQLDGVNAPVYLDAADTIVATDQDGECAMEFIRVNRMWVAGTGWTDYFNMVDVNKNDGSWQYINLYITVYGETVHVLLVNALFEPPAEDVTVTFIVEAGAVGVYAATTTTVVVPAGEEIPASAIPNTEARTGFYFAGWYPSSPAEYGYVTEDTTFTARFNPLFHYVTFEAGHGGQVIPADGLGLIVRIRDGFTFWPDRVPTPVADAGYEFIEWYPSNPAGFVVRDNITFTAVFAPVEPNLCCNSDCTFLQERAPGILANGLTPQQLHLSGNNNAVLTLILDGRQFILSHSTNNRNVSGEIPLGSGCYLVFDISGNGSNVRVFEVVRR